MLINLYSVLEDRNNCDLLSVSLSRATLTCFHWLKMHPKLDHNTVTVKKEKIFNSIPLPSLGLVASLTTSGFCFLKAGFCLKEAPSPCEGFSAWTGSQQAEPRRLVEVSKSLLLTARLF